MGISRKIFKIAAGAILLFTVLVGTFIAFSIIPVPENYRIFIIQSGSMEPAIKTGSLILVSPQDSYDIGDVITFMNTDLADIPVTHRIVGAEIEEGMILYATQGDANEVSDYSRIRQGQIIGKTILTIPYAGYAVSALRRPLGFAVILFIPVSMIIYDEVRKNSATARKNRIGKENNDPPEPLKRK